MAATPYEADGKPIAGGAHTYPEMAAAGLWTTPSDLARYLIEVQQSLKGEANHVLSQKMTKEMLTPGMGKYGLGLAIGGSDTDPNFGHGGVNAGFESTMTAYENDGEGAEPDDFHGHRYEAGGEENELNEPGAGRSVRIKRDAV